MERKNIERKQRPPIVVVMGHVDHGKTTLLDISAKRASPRGKRAGSRRRSVRMRLNGTDAKSHLLIRPGHEAFSAMRSRGAQAADLAILVIAADEGVKPQTKEAIQILEDTKTPFVVAINKIERRAEISKKRKTTLWARTFFWKATVGR